MMRAFGDGSERNARASDHAGIIIAQGFHLEVWPVIWYCAPEGREEAERLEGHIWDRMLAQLERRMNERP